MTAQRLPVAPESCGELLRITAEQNCVVVQSALSQISTRITRVETQHEHIAQLVGETRKAVAELSQEIQKGYVPRREIDERFQAVKTGIPPWTAVLIGLVTLLGGTLLGVFFKR